MTEIPNRDMKRIERNKYLNELISLRNNGMIKVITGMRRCGKSFLLFELFTSYLKESGVDSDHIIVVDLEDYKNELRLGKYRNIDRIKNVYIENGYTFE